MRRKVLALAVIVALSGCTRTVYVDRPVEHRVEVARPCLQPDDIPRAPVYALEALRPPVTDGEVVLAMREEIAQREGYTAALIEVISGCARP